MDIKPLDEQYTEYSLDAREQRPCGTCRACCTALAVIELQKPDYTRCRHECASGCAIYEQRPESCRHFFCLWKIPGWLLQDEDRPDQLGVVVCVRHVGADKQLEVWELWTGASQQPRVQAFLKQLLVPPVILSPLQWTITC